MRAKKLLGGIASLAMVCALLPTPVFAADYTLGPATSTKVTLSEYNTNEDSYSAEDGYLLTMTVNGVETSIVNGKTYTGTVVLQATPKLVTATTEVTDDNNNGKLDTIFNGMIGTVDTGSINDYLYRTGLYVNGLGIVNENSILSSIFGGTYSSDGVDGITMNSSTSGFNSIIVENNGGATTKRFSIKNSIFNALTNSDGSDVSDFTGYGATIGAFGNVSLNVENVNVKTTGVAKVAFLADGGADLLVKNSIFQVLGGTIYDGYKNNAAFSDMVAPPWVLGISGNARGTNLLGKNSTSTFVDSDFKTTGWGVLSVDAGEDGVINVINSTLKTISNTGYGIYAIGDAKETFYGTTFNVGTYPAILTGGSLRFTSSVGIDSYDTVNGLGEEVFSDVTSERTDGNTVVNSQFGVMAHDGGSIILEKGTIFNTKNAAFLIKNGVVDIKVDNSILNVEDGIILQMIDNDDNAVGVDPAGTVMPTFNTTYSEDPGFPTAPYIGTGEKRTPFGITPAPEGYVYGTEDAVTATFTNVNLKGSMYNATGYEGQAKDLDITLGQGATLKGAISSASAMHVQMKLGSDGYYYDYVKDANGNYVQATNFTINEYYQLGHVTNKAYFNGYNTVSATLTDNAVWTVTDASYLNNLTVGANASVVGKMTVNGVATKIEAGKTYTGTIVLSAADAVKTGDATQAMTWILLCGLSAVVAVGGKVIYNKRAKSSN